MLQPKKAKEATPKTKTNKADSPLKTKTKADSTTTPMPKRAIMASILLTSGPITTLRVVSSLSKFHKTSKEQFQQAAEDLKAANLGELFEVKLGKVGGTPTKVFVKKHPAEVEEALQENEDLCTIEQYKGRYEQAPSKSIPLKLRSKLVEMGVVFEKQMK